MHHIDWRAQTMKILVIEFCPVHSYFSSLSSVLFSQIPSIYGDQVGYKISLKIKEPKIFYDMKCEFIQPNK